MSAKSVASTTSFFTRRSPQFNAFGLARCTVAPNCCNKSTIQYHPYVASITTSGHGPAADTAAAIRPAR
jgi:hypothetical protein